MSASLKENCGSGAARRTRLLERLSLYRHAIALQPRFELVQRREQLRERVRSRQEIPYELLAKHRKFATGEEPYGNDAILGHVTITFRERLSRSSVRPRVAYRCVWRGRSRVAGRIVMLEDGFLPSDRREDPARTRSADVIGPFGSSCQERDIMEAGELDGALVDIDLGSGRSSNFARLLD